MRTLIATIVGVMLMIVTSVGAVQAQNRDLSLIRDAEIENIIGDYATPIFSAAGLTPDAVEIHLVNSDDLNAFVAGGQHLFINTGLLIRAETPEQVIGVIAHEAGHIAGGHLARLQEELRNAEIKAIIAAVLGGAAGVASGDGRAAGAIIGGGTAAAQLDLLKYSRTQESSADAAAMKYLDEVGISSKGLLQFFDVLQRDIRMTGGREHPYLSTHPLTNDRINAVASHLALSKHADARVSKDLIAKHAIMRAKLIGFMRPFEEVRERYPETDTSLPARYARAIAYYRLADLRNAVPLVDDLIAEEPENPYFRELKGQMLLENGRIADALPPYEKAVELAPDEPLLRVALAHTQLEMNDPSLVEPARDNLRTVLAQDRSLGQAWRLMTVAYGRLGDQGNLALAQAEYALVRGDTAQASAQARRATEILPVGSAGALRAEDIISEAKRRESRD